jgi:exosortase/archaeosortase family protein
MIIKYYYSLITRFLLALVVTLNYPLFYVILAPITLYLSYFILNLFYDTILIGSSIGVNGLGFKFIEACVAPAAYYLLFVLIIGLKDLDWKSGLKMFFYGSLLILAMNVLRIIILIVLDVEFGKSYFDAVHLVFWTFLSGLYVALVWIFLVKRFRVRKIPFYSDLNYFYKKSLLKRSKTKVNK